MADKDNDGIPDSLDVSDDRPVQGPPTPRKVSPRKRLETLLQRRFRAIETGEREILRDINRRIERFLELHSDNKKLFEIAEDAGYNIQRVDVAEPPVQGPGLGGRDPDADYDDPSTKKDESKDSAVSQVAAEDKGFDEPENPPDFRNQARDNRLLGKQGVHYDIVRGPKGSYLARYKFSIAGETVQIGIRIPRKDLDKYGIKADDAKQLTREQMKKIEGIGWADELTPYMRKGDAHVMKALTRYLSNQYGGQAMLENDEVMGVVIANSLFGWSTGEFENGLRNTKWYQNTNDYQRQFQTVMSEKQRKDVFRQTFEQVTNTLEQHYGLEWVKFVDGGMEKARQWAETISSGKWGTPDAGLTFWSERQFDKAAKSDGTPAWILKQQELEKQRTFNNRPEDMFETLRTETMNYLGQIDGRPLIDRETLMGWANDLVTKKRDNNQWKQFLRQQMRNLHPYFDENQSFKEQASPHKSIAESILGRTLTWDDKVLLQIADRDSKGELKTRSLHDFAQYVRDNDPRFWENPQTEERARSFGQEVIELMGGAG